MPAVAKAIRFAEPNELADATFVSAIPGQPVITGDSNVVDGTDLDCLKCGSPITRNMPSGYHFEVNLKCSSCGSVLRLVY
jgi:hypothetical protein